MPPGKPGNEVGIGLTNGGEVVASAEDDEAGIKGGDTAGEDVDFPSSLFSGDRLLDRLLLRLL